VLRAFVVIYTDNVLANALIKAVRAKDSLHLVQNSYVTALRDVAYLAGKGI
jgi:hypothetical protein